MNQESSETDADEMLKANAEKAKIFQEANRKIDKLNEDLCKVKRMSIHNQLIETVLERLPTMALMTTILFAYFDCDRLGHLIGMSLKDGYYIAIVVFTFACGLLGLINPLIHLRSIRIQFLSIILVNCNSKYLLRNSEFLPLGTTFAGFICQFISIGAMMATKLVIISNLLIYAPFVYPIGMLLELFIILPFAWFFKSKI